MKQNRAQPVIIKKRSSRHRVHNGAWKIAYADFMTAMMALFLLMWIMSAITEEQRHQLAGYFNTGMISDFPYSDNSAYREDIISGVGNDIIPLENLGTLDEAQQEKYEFEKLKRRIDDIIDSDPQLSTFKSNLLMTVTVNGLLIQLIDSHDRPMFMLGSQVPEAHLIHVLQKLVPILNEIPQKITLTGHTDSIPYAKGEAGYSNWELSTDRANTARQTLVAAGLQNGKILQIIGVANNKDLPETNSNPSLNRRITLMILAEKREKAIKHEERIINDMLKLDNVDGNNLRLSPTTYLDID